MAIPTSTIVMAVLTAVPFGLAIKDTVQGKSAVDVSTEQLQAVDEPTEVMDRAARDYEDAKQKRSLEIDAAIKALIPDTMGVLHVDTTQIETILRGTVSPSAKKTTLTFPPYIGDDSICSTIRARLDRVWGERSSVDMDEYTHYTWTSVEPRQRVTFREPHDDIRCELVTEPYVAEDFVGMAADAIVPVWAVDKPAAKLVAKLGDDAFSDATQIRWSRPGVGEGYGETELYARVVKGKVVTITARFQASVDTVNSISEHLTDEFGKQPENDPTVWKKAKLALVTLDENAGEYMIVVGQPLPVQDDE
jgi:hypothetical protein